MSYYAMTNKELSQTIRKALKESGFTSKDYSIRVRPALYDKSVDIRVKNPLVRISEIEKVVKRFREVEYDERTAEILSGCNVYVHCQYEFGIFDDLVTPLMETSEKVLNDGKYDGRKIAENEEKEIHIIRINGVESRLIEYKKSEKQQESNSYIIHFAGDLAVAMWRFKHLGTIYA